MTEPDQNTDTGAQAPDPAQTQPEVQRAPQTAPGTELADQQETVNDQLQGEGNSQ